MLSMTGFGRSIFSSAIGKFSVEIQSVNRKYSEVWVSLPRELNRFEFHIRKWMNEAISRGQINVRIFLTVEEGSSSLLPSSASLKELKQSWVDLALEVGLNPTEVNLSFLLQRLAEGSSVFAIEEESILPLLKKGVEVALEGLYQMKQAEGNSLQQDLLARLKTLQNKIAEIQQKTPNATEKQRKKLKDRMEEIFSPSLELDERLLREVALFAERVDISEEIQRLSSHILQFETITQQKGTIGRKLDFLIQEMGREFNTIGSKAADSEISHLIVECKSELEKMREQVQNVE